MGWSCFETVSLWSAEDIYAKWQRIENRYGGEKLYWLCWIDRDLVDVLPNRYETGNEPLRPWLFPTNQIVFRDPRSQEIEHK